MKTLDFRDTTVTSHDIKLLMQSQREVTIHLSDSKVFIVKNPDFILYPPNKKTVIIYEEPEGERSFIINVNQVSYIS